MKSNATVDRNSRRIERAANLLRALAVRTGANEMPRHRQALADIHVRLEVARCYQRRLQAIKGLSDAGVPAAVMFAPAIPALNDGELEAVLSAAKDMGARSAGYVLLRLPLEIKDLFREWLEVNVPDRAKHVMSLVRQMRGGKDYDSQWHTRMRGTGPYAEMIAKRFQLAIKRYDLNKPSRPLDISQFRKPAQKGDQLSLFAAE